MKSQNPESLQMQDLKTSTLDSGAQSQDFSAKSLEPLINALDWDKQNGLIPAIVQDFQTKQVLMLAFMNRQALELSLQTNQMHYFSRSKNRIWKKGESSEHIQNLKQCFIDCDNDSMLFLVEQVGVACHTGSVSCFFKEISSNEILDSRQNAESSTLNYGTIDTLYHTLLERKNADAKSSYTASLYAKGINTIGKKIIEEATEVIIALKDKDNAQIVYESADLTYHMLVALAHQNIHPEQILQELSKRFGVGGLIEKANRTKEK